ncbi:hypothetical protein ACIQOV_27790 [Kitasatospora sp. NPDC091257]|uniref:hypothetical protein n=1 Tax=Kitasatospora sp. NPDC091257 TaxID=3364084 RepID=UPI0038168C12
MEEDGRGPSVRDIFAARHQLLAHGLAAAILHERGLGAMLSNNLTSVEPASSAVHLTVH